MDIEEAVVLEDADDVGGQLNAVGGRPRASGILELDGFNTSTVIWYDWMHVWCGISADQWECTSSLRYHPCVERREMAVNDGRCSAMREWESTQEDDQRVEVALGKFSGLSGCLHGLGAGHI